MINYKKISKTTKQLSLTFSNLKVAITLFKPDYSATADRLIPTNPLRKIDFNIAKNPKGNMTIVCFNVYSFGLMFTYATR